MNVGYEAMEILSLSIDNAVVDDKVVHRSSMLLSTEHCHRSEEGSALARERKDDGINENTIEYLYFPYGES